MKHHFHALVLFSKKNPPACALATEGQTAGSAAVKPHLLLNAGAHHIIGFSQAAVFVNPDFRDDKKGNPLGSSRRTFDTGKHRVDDVFSEVMIAGGNKYLAAGYAVSTVSVSHGRCGQSAHIGAGLRFGEQHGSAPFSGVELFEEFLFECFGAEKLNHFSGAVPQQGIAGKREVGAHEVFVGGGVDQVGKPLAADFWIFGKCAPFPFSEELEGLAEAFRGTNLAAFEPGAVAVAFSIGRQDFLEGKSPGFSQQQVKGFAIAIPVAFMLRHRLQVELFVKHEVDVSAICDELCHGFRYSFVFGVPRAIRFGFIGAWSMACAMAGLTAERVPGRKKGTCICLRSCLGPRRRAPRPLLFAPLPPDTRYCRI